jgi:hypothetical protein
MLRSKAEIINYNTLMGHLTKSMDPRLYKSFSLQIQNSDSPNHNTIDYALTKLRNTYNILFKDQYRKPLLKVKQRGYDNNKPKRGSRGELRFNNHQQSKYCRYHPNLNNHTTNECRFKPVSNNSNSKTVKRCFKCNQIWSPIHLCSSKLKRTQNYNNNKKRTNIVPVDKDSDSSDNDMDTNEEVYEDNDLEFRAANLETPSKKMIFLNLQIMQ